jgi:glycine cleavage system aminomethyltransferase T
MSTASGVGPAHYGCPAGELAVCVEAVGLADLSHLRKISLAGDPTALMQVVRDATGYSLRPGGCVEVPGVWWCAPSPERLIALVEGTHPMLSEIAWGHGVPGVTVTDHSTDWSAIGLIGRAAMMVLARLGVVGNPRLAAPFGRVAIGGAEVGLLLQSDRRAVLLVDCRSAADVWHAIEEEGRAFGISCVGADARGRFAILERLAGRAATGARGD